MSDKQQKIDEISIESLDSILAALKKMDETYKRLLLVFSGNHFINVLSIGDIQRAIIRNNSLDTPVKDILRQETRVAHINTPYIEIKKQMLSYKAECMPVVNENNELVDVHFWEDVFPANKPAVKKIINVPVVIMAGGKGSRLKPLTNIIPKPLIPINEKTILEEIMDRFVAHGCNNFYLSVNYKAETIKHYFEILNNEQYHLNFFQECKPLGTAGSIHLLKHEINSTFFVSNCDIIIDNDYSEIYDYHKENRNDITIVAALKHFPIPYGTLETAADGILKSLSEKPELVFKINSGMYILEPQMIQFIPHDEFYHITTLISDVQKNGGKVGVFPVSENSWKDIGDWDNYNILLKRN